jgi:hypothetical protein
MNDSEGRLRGQTWWLSAFAGALLGCLFRLGSAAVDRFTAVMTLAFVVGVPFAMGYVSVARYLRSTPDEQISAWKWLLLPWASVLVSMAVALVIQWEGYACLVSAAPIMLLVSLLGGFFARGTWVRSRSARSGTTLLVSALPLLGILVEAHLPAPWETRTVHTQIEIHAPSPVVWANIKSVRTIEAGELKPAWVTRIGFPKPLAATLSHDGIGGVRQASFTGGVLFTETVNGWEPEKNLRFSIRANTASIPAATLDEHVTIGGAFFDVLEGEYTIEPVSGGVLLHLASRERLSTHFNLYAGLWTDAVMRSIQQQILEVIRRRCENDGRPVVADLR